MRERCGYEPTNDHCVRNWHLPGPQNRATQIAALEAAGVIIAPTNADAAVCALACLRAGS